jgi:hypothetical protein
MNNLVCRARHNVFLREHFQAVRNELAEAGEAPIENFIERPRHANAVRAVAVLDAADALTLENRDDGKIRREHREDKTDANQRRHQRTQHFRHEAHEPVQRVHENLVELVKHFQVVVGGLADGDAMGAVAAAAAALALASASAFIFASAAALALASALAFSAAMTASDSAASTG